MSRFLPEALDMLHEAHRNARGCFPRSCYEVDSTLSRSYVVMLGVFLLLTSLLGQLKNRAKQTQLIMSPGKYFLALASKSGGCKTCC